MRQEVETIERRVYSTSQDQRYEHYFSYTDSNIVCKIFIKSGSTKSDCQAQIYVLDKKTYQWQLVYFIPSQLMRTEPGLLYTNKDKNRNMEEYITDALVLMSKVEELLG